MRSFARSFWILLLACSAVPLAAQDGAVSRPAPADTAGAFLDAGAATLLHRARAARTRTNHTLRSYTAVVSSRMAAGLRMPLKDRSLLRMESTARVRWSRDGDDVVQILAGRAQAAGTVTPASGSFGDTPYDPTQDRLYFGLMSDSARGGDDFWVEHPIGGQSERHYRFQSGDTMVIRLQDGSVLRVAELNVIPRRNDPKTVRGVLWVDIASGALVRGAFRLARRVDILRDLNHDDDEEMATASRIPLVNPMEFDISLMTVEYSLWDMQHWLMRSTRMEGLARAGVLQFPAAFDISYRMLDVVTDRDAMTMTEAEAIAQTIAEWSSAGDTVRARRRNRTTTTHVIRPKEGSVLLDSEILPPPIWDDAPGFATEEELKNIADRVAAVARPPQPGLPVSFGWGLGAPGVTRYNRVEALSVGARLTVPLPYLTVSALGRIGAGDLHPNVALELGRETTGHALELRGYHELATAEPSRRAFGAGNSLAAALFGRDEGEYYRATGASFAVAPPPLNRQSWQLRGYAELQDAVERNTHIALPRLWSDHVFRPNIAADEATQYGAVFLFRPWWGSQPDRAQFGLDMMVQAETGDYEHVRGRATLRSAAPLLAGVRIGFEAGVGTSEGDVPVQRLFYLGGASTLRGYEPATVAGTSMARGRLEVARFVRWGNLALFTDWAWAGDRTDVRGEDQRWAAGAGVSLLDGLVRLDLARGLRAPRGWRLDLHLDSLL
jgi:hypothetical protein